MNIEEEKMTATELNKKKGASVSYRIISWLRSAGPILFLIFWSIIALFPIYIILVNAFKNRNAIFKYPFNIPNAETFSLIGFETVNKRANFARYFTNSIVVTVVSLAITLLIATMASFALSRYKFKGATLLSLIFSIGIMIPIRLATVGILRLMVNWSLTNTLLSLIIVYIAQSLPMAIFILSSFMKQIPQELIDAARVDGASEYRIYWMILPLIRPALGAIGIFSMIPIWNDLWWPLILAPSAETATVTLGAQQFLGQYMTDWNAVLASLTMSIIPILIFYLLFSKQMIKSITSGAIKS
jgi:raffinose/stachyose/melibiose transport system permease protein